MTLSGINAKGASTMFAIRDITEVYVNDVTVTQSTIGFDVSQSYTINS